MGGDPVFWRIDSTPSVQLAEACGDLVLQYGPDTAGVVQYLAHPRRAFQPGETVFSMTVSMC